MYQKIVYLFIVKTHLTYINRFVKEDDLSLVCILDKKVELPKQCFHILWKTFKKCLFMYSQYNFYLTERFIFYVIIVEKYIKTYILIYPCYTRPT